MISILLKIFGVFYGLENALSWWMLHVSFRRMYILLLFDKVVYRYLYRRIRSRWLMVLFSSTMSLLIFYLLDLPVTDSGVLKSPTIIVCSSFSQCNSISFLLHVVWCSIVRHIHLKDCYVFLENWSICLYVMLFFIPDNFFLLWNLLCLKL